MPTVKYTTAKKIGRHDIEFFESDPGKYHSWMLGAPVSYFQFTEDGPWHGDDGFIYEFVSMEKEVEWEKSEGDIPWGEFIDFKSFEEFDE